MVAESGICPCALRKLTEEDEDMLDIENVIKCGWPKAKFKDPITAMPYHSFQDEMAYYNFIVMKGCRCVVPSRRCTEVIDNIHQAHSGVEGCIHLAREHMYRPGGTAQVKEAVSNHDTFFRLTRALQNEPMPSSTWQ